MGGRCSFPSWCGAPGVQDAALNSFGRVVFAQGLEPNRPILTRRFQRHVFAVKAEGITLLLQHPQKLLPSERGGDGGVYILLDDGFPSGLSLLLGQPLGIGEGHPFRFLGVDDREMVFPAQFIRDPPYLCEIAFLIASVLLTHLDGNGIPYQMVVDMPGVQMGADNHLKFAAQQTIRKFLGQPDGPIPALPPRWQNSAPSGIPAPLFPCATSF